MPSRSNRWYDIGYTYSLKRAYPFPYFTTSVSLVLVLSLGASTLYNIATNGFELQTQYTIDPNSTQMSRPWFLSSLFTLGDNQLYPRCPPREIEVGSYFTTTNRAYIYVLNSIRHVTYNVTTNIPSHSPSPSVLYLNNSLQNCQVAEVDLHLIQTGSAAPTAWFAWEGSYASIVAQCHIENDQGLFNLEFTTTHGLSDTIYKYKGDDNYQTHASIWWGMRLLESYWVGTLTVMGKDKVEAPGQSAPWIDANLKFLTNSTHTGPPESPHLFELRYSFTTSNGHMLHQGMDHFSKNSSQRYNNPNFWASAPLTEALSFARIYYSLIKLDLGQNDRSYLLDTNESLKSTLLSPYNFNRQPGGLLTNQSAFDFARYGKIAAPPSFKHRDSIVLRESYDRYRNHTGPLGTQEAYIFSRYNCLVPNLKSIGTVVWSTLVANFVLVTAARSLCLYIAELVLMKRDPTAMDCDCFAAQQKQQQNDAKLVILNRSDEAFVNEIKSSSDTDITSLPPLSRTNSNYPLLRDRHQAINTT